MKIKKNSEIAELFHNYLDEVNYEGLLGVANFSEVYNSVMDEQKQYLESICGVKFNNYVDFGSIISLGIAYHPETIESINIKEESGYNKELWNQYGYEYSHLNKMLKEISEKIAKLYNGIAIPPTTETPSKEIRNVKDFFPNTLSHRAVAENAGLGWRGKNELLITYEYGPAIRFVSILVSLKFIEGKRIDSQCGECNACLEICPILREKSNLKDYRENCRLYLNSLGLVHDVCGKCIKACFKEIISRKR
jgi:epoxyqueuosine reductase QueG